MTMTGMGKPSWTRIALAGALVAALGACSSATAPFDPVPLAQLEPPAPTTVRPGDVVVVRFWGQEDISGELIVDDDGNIQLPLLKDVRVEGLSAEEIRARLTEAYGEFYADPLLIVNVKLGVNVSGAVSGPGRFLVDPGFNIFDVLGMAGGERSEAKRSGVILYREGTAYEIHLNKAALATEPEKLRVQSGDWIYVPSRFWTLQRVSVLLSVAVLGITLTDLIISN